MRRVQLAQSKAKAQDFNMRAFRSDYKASNAGVIIQNTKPAPNSANGKLNGAC